MVKKVSLCDLSNKARKVLLKFEYYIINIYNFYSVL